MTDSKIFNASGGRIVTDDLDALLDVLPPRISQPLLQIERREELLEVVMDLGREPEGRFPEREAILSSDPIVPEDLEYVIHRIGLFGDDNRAGIERTLHRISAIRNRADRIVGLTCRVGRAVFGTITIIRDLIESGQSVLMMGRPGVGKTTMLREAARVLADDLNKRVIIVDTSNEIGGDGDIPHPAIGRARRMQVKTPALQHSVMIEAVENHMPEVIVIDEIGTELEALASRTIAERGVQLIATAHGNTLENLIMNPTLADLIGGIQTVTLSDEEARRRGTQKSVLERKAPPTFDMVVEIQAWDRVRVHENVADTVDAVLRGHSPAAAVRSRDEHGDVVVERTPLRRTSNLTELVPDNRHAVGVPMTPRDIRTAPGKTVRIYPFGVNRSKIEQTARSLSLPVIVVEEVDEADVAMTLKPYYRRKPQPLRDAEARGIPIYVLRSNSGGQIEEALGRVLQMDVTPNQAAPRALQETEEAIARVLETSEPVELSPQNSYIRRLQHELAGQYSLGSESMGREPYRRVRIFKPAS
jgi:stage III sporulation protein SpoIIIAA